MRASTGSVWIKYRKSLNTGMNSLDLNGKLSGSSWEEEEEGWRTCLSEIWLVKKEWRIERRRETSLWFLTRCAETEGTVKS